MHPSDQQSIMIEVMDNPNEYIDEEKNKGFKRMQNNAVMVIVMVEMLY